MAQLTNPAQTLTSVAQALYYQQTFGDCVVLMHAQKVDMRPGFLS